MKNYLFYSIFLLSMTSLAIAGQGGPDAYGYTWKDSNDPSGPTFNWINIATTGTQVTGLGDDNFVGPFGFIDGFQYYWYYPNQVWIGANGYLSFSGNTFATPFPNIPNIASPHNFIAGLMSDLNFDGPGNPGTCYYRNTADTIVISWINVPFWTMGTPFFSGSNSFQIVLVRSDRSITFNYLSQLGMTLADDITIGIENITGQMGLQHSKNVYPSGGYSVKFYYPTTTNQAVDGGVHWNMEEGNGGVFVKRYSPVPIVTNIKNFGIQPLSNINISASITHPTALGMTGTGQIANLISGTDSTFTFSNPLIPTDLGIYNMTSQVGGIVGDLVASNNLLRTKIIAVDTFGTQIPMEYHDGIPDLGGIDGIGGGGGFGYYMRPAFYPCQINGYRLMIASDYHMDGCYLRLYDDDGPNGSPGTLMDSIYADPASYVVGTNSLIPTGNFGITIPNGGFYVLWTTPVNSVIKLARDVTSPISLRSLEYVGGFWAPCRFRFTEDYFLGVSVSNSQPPTQTSLCLPTITTNTPTSVGNDSVVIGGEILNDGGSSIVLKGICYSTTPNPNMGNPRTEEGSGIGSFASTLRNLSPSTTYYARSYAKNSQGVVVYGNEVSFSTGTPVPSFLCGTSTVSDVDGNNYNTVQIGTQCWTQSNLKVSKYRNGDNIPTGLSNSAWENTTAGAYAIFNNDPVNDGLYGKLYNHYAVLDTRGLCPTGWYVPTDREWNLLVMYLDANADTGAGGWQNTNAGGALKSTATQPTPGGWNSPNAGATNSSGFSAGPGALRNPNGGFFNVLGQNGWWWSSSLDGTFSWYRALSYTNGDFYRSSNNLRFGMSVRCLKD
jgi:uncharacterized protein (TIGR02145 family)